MIRQAAPRSVLYLVQSDGAVWRIIAESIYNFYDVGLVGMQ